MPNGEASQRVPLASLGERIFGYIYVYWWVKRANWRFWLDKGAVGILALFVAYLWIELVLEFYGKQMARNHSIAAQLTFLAAFGVALYSKWREFGGRRQEFFFLQASKKIAELLTASREDLSSDGTMDKLLAIFHKTFEKKWPIDVTLALHGPGDKLEIKHRYPPREVPSQSTFGIGEGGAGYSHEKRCIVYIPRKRYGHAVVQTLDGDDPYEMVSDLYVPGTESASYQSILSVPVVIFGHCYGSICFDSDRPNAFRRIDFQQAMVYGMTMAQLLHLKASAGEQSGPPNE